MDGLFRLNFHSMYSVVDVFGIFIRLSYDFKFVRSDSNSGSIILLWLGRLTQSVYLIVFPPFLNTIMLSLPAPIALSEASTIIEILQ